MFALATLRICLIELSKLLAPFTPFVADEIYGNLVGGAADSFFDQPDSVHLCDFPEPDPERVDEELEAQMEVVRRTVELGRAARSHAKVKLRQPLRRAIIVASDAEREGDRGARRAGHLGAEREGARVRARALGARRLPRQGQLPRARARASARTCRRSPPRSRRSTPRAVARVIEGGGEVGISIDGHDHTLERRRDQPGDGAARGLPGRGRGRARRRALAGDGRRAPGARAGRARSSTPSRTRASGAGLEVSDRIVLELAGDAELLDAAREHEDYVSEETLAMSVSYSANGAGESATIDGRELLIAVTRSDEPDDEFGPEDFE